MLGPSSSLKLHSTNHRRGVLGSVTADGLSGGSVQSSYSVLGNVSASTYTSAFAQTHSIGLNFMERVWMSVPSLNALANNATVTLAVLDGSRYSGHSLLLDTVIGGVPTTLPNLDIVITGDGTATTMTQIVGGLGDLTTAYQSRVEYLLNTFTSNSGTPYAYSTYSSKVLVSPNVYTISMLRRAATIGPGQSISAIGGWLIPM